MEDIFPSQLIVSKLFHISNWIIKFCHQTVRVFTIDTYILKIAKRLTGYDFSSFQTISKIIQTLLISKNAGTNSVEHFFLISDYMVEDKETFTRGMFWICPALVKVASIRSDFQTKYIWTWRFCFTKEIVLAKAFDIRKLSTAQTKRIYFINLTTQFHYYLH